MHSKLFENRQNICLYLATKLLFRFSQNPEKYLYQFVFIGFFKTWNTYR